MQQTLLFKGIYRARQVYIFHQHVCSLDVKLKTSEVLALPVELQQKSDPKMTNLNNQTTLNPKS